MSEQQAASSFMAVVEFQVLPSWFELDPRTRKDFTLQIAELLQRHTRVTTRWFDGDAWTGEFSDFVLCEFEDLQSYNSLWLEIRRHPFLATPYAQIGHVLMGMELETEGLAELENSGELEATVESENSGKSCEFCGHQLKTTARFCSRCGRQQEDHD